VTPASLGEAAACCFVSPATCPPFSWTRWRMASWTRTKAASGRTRPRQRRRSTEPRSPGGMRELQIELRVDDSSVDGRAQPVEATSSSSSPQPCSPDRRGRARRCNRSSRAGTAPLSIQPQRVLIMVARQGGASVPRRGGCYGTDPGARFTLSQTQLGKALLAARARSDRCLSTAKRGSMLRLLLELFDAAAGAPAIRPSRSSAA